MSENASTAGESGASGDPRAPAEARALAEPRPIAEPLVVAEARAAGFAMAGVVARERSRHIHRFNEWIKAAMHGEMAYLARPGAAKDRADPSRLLHGYRSAVVVAHAHGSRDHGENGAPRPDPADPSRAVVARYARGRDYHDVVADGLARLARRLEAVAGTPFRRRAHVDTGPVLERELAMRAGLGWFGKNTMLIHPRRGSYFLLGVLLTDLPLQPSRSFRHDRCGTCRSCLDACPTGALLGRDERGAPVMDARLCISYLTIELKGPIPEELRPAIGNRVFGCDICQEVCPWNRKFAAPPAHPAYSPRPELDNPSLVELAERVLDMSGKAYLREFRDSPLSRPRRSGMLRNLCVALGNWGSREAVPVLERAARDRSPLVREHARWALERIAEGSSGAVPEAGGQGDGRRH